MVNASIIGSESWNAEIRETLEKLRSHKHNYSECARIEEDRLWRMEKPPGPLEDRINQICGVSRLPNLSTWIMGQKPPPEWKRPQRVRGYYRRIAMSMADQLSGYDLLLDSRLTVAKGRLDPRLDWLLHEIYTLAQGSDVRNFLVTIAKDAGVWPSPKWWRVTRILLGDNRSFRKSTSYK